MASRRLNTGKLSPAQQADVIARLQKGARQKGARNVREVCKILDISRSCFYAWAGGRSIMTRQRSYTLLKAAGCTKHTKAPHITPDHVEQAWRVYQVVRVTFADALLQCLWNKEPVWVVTARSSVQVSLVQGWVTLQIGKQQVLTAELSDAVLEELARVLNLLVTNQRQRPTSSTAALTRLTRRFSRAHAR